MQIIGLTGLAQCGKTTLADEISRIAYHRGMTPKKMSFAGRLKKAAAEIGADKVSQPELYRKFCQEVGNNMRSLEYLPGVTGPDYWVQRTHEDIAIEQAKENARPVYGDGKEGKWSETVLIFDDVRFENEVELLKNMGATLILLNRGKELPDPAAKFRSHISEKLAYDLMGDHELRMKYMNFTVDSTGSMEQFKFRCSPYIPHWLGLEALDLNRYPRSQA